MSVLFDFAERFEVLAGISEYVANNVAALFSLLFLLGQMALAVCLSSKKYSVSFAEKKIVLMVLFV